MSEWTEGFAAGYSAAVVKYTGGGNTISAAEADRIGLGNRAARIAVRRPKATKRKASAYSKRYGKAFKRLAPRYKKKSGGWKKNGFRLCAAAARKAAKK